MRLLWLTLGLVTLVATSAYVLDHDTRGRRGGRQHARREGGRVEMSKFNEEEEWNNERTEHETTTVSGNRTNLSSFLDRYLPSGHQSHFQLGPGLNISFSSGFNFGGRGRWWNGPNVCMTEEVVESNRSSEASSGSAADIFYSSLMVSHSCEETDAAYLCISRRATNGRTVTTTKTYECCPGFGRDEDEPECKEAGELVDLISTMEVNSMTEMVKALTISGLTSLVQSGNYTVFVPTNEAFDRYIMKDSERNVIVVNPSLERMSGGLSTSISAHIAPGFLKLSRVSDEDLISTEHSEAKIRINKYNLRNHRKPIMTANCAPIIQSDVKSSNGLIHLVDEVLQPVRNDIKTIIRSRPELSKFNQALAAVDINDEGQYTIFAPTNEAFAQLQPALLDKILEGSACGKDLVKHHILPNVICSQVIHGRVRSQNVLSKYLLMSRDDDVINIESSVVLEKDIMATNGVIHIIDKVILPSEVKDIGDALEEAGATKFLELLQSNGLMDRLQRMDHFTLFAPTNAALQGLPSIDVPQAEALFNSHVVPNLIHGRQLMNGLKLTTVDEKNELRVNEYEAFFSFSRRPVKLVQCSPITHTDLPTCGGVIHLVDKVINPPNDNIMSVLESREDFSDLTALIRLTGLVDLLSGGDHPLTIFAPTNNAFSKLSEAVRNELRNGSEKALQVLRSHVINDVLCCGGVSHLHYIVPFERNLDNWMTPIQSSRGRVYYGRTPVQSCDQGATNGVIHALDDFSELVMERYFVNPRRRSENRRGSWMDRFLNELFD